MLGPNGPLPIHITEYVRHRLRHAGDPTLSRFLDLLNHRFLALLYRAWAQAQQHANRDRPDEDDYRTYVGSFIGIAPSALGSGAWYFTALLRRKPNQRLASSFGCCRSAAARSSL